MFHEEEDDGNYGYSDDYDFGCYSYLAEQVLPKRPQVDTVKNVCDFLESPSNRKKLNLTSHIQQNGKNLDLCHLGINDDLVQKLCKSLERTSLVVESIDLSLNTIGDKGAISIGRMLRCNQTIKELLLNDNKIGDKGAKEIADSFTLGGNDIRMECLGLSMNKIGDKGIMYLCQSLTPKNPSSSRNNSMTNFTSLGIHSNKFGQKCTKYIRDMLIRNKNITDLIMFNNSIGDVGATTIAEGIQANQTLTQLALLKCKIGDKGIQSIARALEVNTTLKELILCGNSVSDVGAKALGNMLSLNKGPLSSLDITDNSECISYVGYEALTAGWRNHYYLVELEFDFNVDDFNVDDEEVEEQIEQIRVLFDEQSVLSVMNKCCHRSILEQGENDVPDSLWANILSKVGKTKTNKHVEAIDPSTPTFVFQMLKHKPALFLPRVENNGKVIKKDDAVSYDSDPSFFSHGQKHQAQEKALDKNDAAAPRKVERTRDIRKSRWSLTKVAGKVSGLFRNRRSATSIFAKKSGR